MGEYVADRTKALMISKKILLKDSKVLIMGFSFKENCPDIRNSLVFDLYSSMKMECGIVDVFDPWVDSKEAKDYYDLEITKKPKTKYYDSIIIAIAHREFTNLGIEEIRKFGKDKLVIFDIKSIFDSSDTDGRL